MRIGHGAEPFAELHGADRDEAIVWFAGWEGAGGVLHNIAEPIEVGGGLGAIAAPGIKFAASVGGGAAFAFVGGEADVVVAVEMF